MKFTDTHSPELGDSDAEPEALPNFPADASNEQAAAEVGVADYFNSHPEEAASILVAKAPDVLVLARCIGAPKTANYFAKRLKCKITERMIKTIKSKVAKDIILVTREELETAARSHPITAARMAREPSLCDPQHYKTSIKPELEDHEVEVGAAKKAAAKKAAAERSKKPTESKTPSATPTGLQQPKTGTPTILSNPEAPKGMRQIVSDEEAEENDRLLEEAARRLRGG